MKKTAALVAMLLALFCTLPVRATEGQEVFLITVTLEDPVNPHLQLRLPVKAGQPFQVVSTIGEAVTTVSGTLSPASGGKYLLPLKISEAYKTFPAAHTASQTCALEINKPQSSTFMVGRLVFNQTVLLSRFEAR